MKFEFESKKALQISIRRLLDAIGNSKSRILIFSWLLALIGVIVSLQNMQGAATQFFGITYSREQTISFQYPVEIARINVVEGEKVERKTLLLEAFRDDLVANQKIIDENLTEIKTSHSESTATTYATLQSLIAERKARVTEITTRINKLESQYKLNMELLEDISGVKNSQKDANDNPLLVEIIGLKTAREHVKNKLQAQILNLEKQLGTDIRPADAQIAELEKRKLEFKRQAEELNVFAKFNGSIGRILFKPGEQVRPFTPILTLHDERPSFVKGYIHENVVHTLKLDQSVWLQSTSASSDGSSLICGVVESIGSRMIEYPGRLIRNPIVSAWGREVVIRLVEQSQFLLNEKVRIFQKEPKAILLRLWVFTIFERLLPQSILAHFTNLNGSPFARSYQSIRSAVSDLSSSEIEASGIVWDKHTGAYLVVSDETINSLPSIFEMNRHGEITSRLKINGAITIDDLESISLDGSYVYIASSLSNKKKTAPKPERRKLVRLERTSDGLKFRGEIDLYDTFIGILERGDADLETTQFLHRALDNYALEIESHTIIDDNLYLGFKYPLNQKGNAVILGVSGVAGLFSGQSHIGASIWLTLNLHDPVTGHPTAMSDMTMQGDQLYLLSGYSRKRNRMSHFWRYCIERNRLSLIASYPNRKAEGITLCNNQRTAMIVFDSGGKAPSEFILTGVGLEEELLH